MNLIDLKSNNQEILLGYDNLFINIINLYKNKKLPNIILFSGSKGIGKATFSFFLIENI